MPEVGLWHVRVHYGAYEPEALISFLKDHAEVILAVLESDASRSHIHCVVTGFPKTASTFRQQLLKQFPALKGNGGNSVAPKQDKESLLRYCCKGPDRDTLPFVLARHFDVDVEYYHTTYWIENAALRSKSERNKGLQKGISDDVVKSKSKSWTDRVCDMIESTYFEEMKTIRDYYVMTDAASPYETNDFIQAKRVLFRFVMKCLGQGRKKISLKILQEMFDGIINWIVQTGSDEGAEKYSDRYFTLIYGHK